MPTPMPAAVDPRRPDHAPHCSDAWAILAALGVRPTCPWLWLHVGPIGERTTPLSLHGTQAAPTPTRRKQGGGGVRICELHTVRSWRAFGGSRVDLLVLRERPPDGLIATARRSTLRGIGTAWAIYAAACDDPSGVWVAWDAGTNEYVHHLGRGRLSTADDFGTFQRLEDLIIGHRRRGRPGVVEMTSAREIAEAAARRKAEHPSLSWEAIAGPLGLDARTLRRYRALLDDVTAGASTAPDGGAPLALWRPP